MKRKELLENRAKAIADMQGIVETAKAEKRDLTHEERQKATGYVTEVKGIDDQMQSLEDSARETKSIHEFLEAADRNGVNEKALDGAGSLAGRSKSVGQLISGSEQYKSLMNRHGGQISEGTKGIHMDPVAIGGLKALLTSGASGESAGQLVEPDKLGVVPYPTLPLSLRQLITVGTTNSDRVEYAQVLPAGVGDSKNNSRGVPEAKSGTDKNGVKPESALSFRKAGAEVITIAHWLPATKRALSDVGQLQTLIDGFLRDGIARTTERLIVSGDKDAAAADTEEWDGILNTTGVQEVASLGSIAQTARRMITRVTGTGSEFTGFIVSPEVDEQLDLLQDDNGRFFGLGPFGIGPTTLWGRPRVVVHGLPANTIVGGDLKQCVLWDREQTTVTATDSHADFFIKNLVAVLAEARAAFGILNPAALAVAEVDGGGAEEPGED